MELRQAEAINVAIDAVTINWDIEKRKQYANWLLQFGGVYCPKRDRKIVEFDLGNETRIDNVRRT